MRILNDQEFESINDIIDLQINTLILGRVIKIVNGSIYITEGNDREDEKFWIPKKFIRNAKINKGDELQIQTITDSAGVVVIVENLDLKETTRINL